MSSHSRERSDASPDEEENDDLIRSSRDMETLEVHIEQPPSARSPGRVVFIRALALLCACSLSIGSHYATNMLGPLKSRLSREMGTNNAEFSLMVAALSLNSTWTPLVGGLLASKLGTTFTSILATGVIFLGQALLLIGNIAGSVRLMVFGMFVFGLGVSPLAVTQEAIIVRFFKSHGLGVGLAFGLVAGKTASFVAARTSYPLSERYGPHAPFIVATALAGFSVIMNTVFISASRWLVTGTGIELEANEIEDEARKRASFSLSEAQALEEVAKKRRVDLSEVTKLGDVFWAYIGLNIFCGMIWHPFAHLAANIFQQRYGLSESDSGAKASYLLAGSVFLYPICGFIVDRIKIKGIILKMLTLSSCFTLSCYCWLALPPSLTHTPVPAVGLYGLALGFSPLLLVVLVPQLVPMKYVSTTLGAHKSLENVGSTVMQTMAGLMLDVSQKKLTVTVTESGSAASTQTLINGFALISVLQLLSILALTILQRRQTALQDRRSQSFASDRRRSITLPKEPVNLADDAGSSSSIPRASTSDDVPESPELSMSQSAEQQRPLLHARQQSYSPPGSVSPPPSRFAARTAAEARRGRVFAGTCLGLIVFAWVLFLGTAWAKLRSRSARGGVVGEH